MAEFINDFILGYLFMHAETAKGQTDSLPKPIKDRRRCNHPDQGSEQETRTLNPQRARLIANRSRSGTGDGATTLIMDQSGNRLSFQNNLTLQANQ